jgi:hypothetical protein
MSRSVTQRSKSIARGAFAAAERSSMTVASSCAPGEQREITCVVGQ